MTEQQRIEELMKPRYKVIADWPGNVKYKVGDVLSGHLNGDRYQELKTDENGNSYWMCPHVFPHLFKRLEWYEDRKPEEMPEFVKFPNNGTVMNPVAVDVECGWFYLTDEEFFQNEPHSLRDTLPATIDEYNQYINSRQ